MKYLVTTKEVWHSTIEIEAKSEDEAINKVQQGEGIPVDTLFEYSHTLDSATWDIEEYE